MPDAGDASALIEARAELVRSLIAFLELTHETSGAVRREVNDAADAIEDALEQTVEEWRRLAGVTP
jgi:hypothetical protein